VTAVEEEGARIEGLGAEKSFVLCNGFNEP